MIIDELPEKKRRKMQNFIEELFDSNMEIESWISSKESLPSMITKLNQTNNNIDNPFSHQSLNYEHVEIADLNFFRDLGPLARKVNMSKYQIHYIHQILQLRLEVAEKDPKESVQSLF